MYVRSGKSRTKESLYNFMLYYIVLDKNIRLEMFMPLQNYVLTLGEMGAVRMKLILETGTRRQAQ